MFKKIKLIPVIACAALIFSSGTYNYNDSNAEILITFDGGGGKFSNGESSITETYTAPVEWSSIKNICPKPTYSGKDLIKWTFSDGSGDVTDSSVFTKDTTIVANWGALTPTHFATDSWATLVDVTKGWPKNNPTMYGLEALRSAYHEDMRYYGDTFIISANATQEEIDAKTRTISLGDLGTFTCKVIGENRDVIKDNENDLASLTFEFNEVVLNSIAFGTSSSKSYQDSYLRERNQELVDLFPDCLTEDSNGLQTVVKTNYDCTTADKVFSMSNSEFGNSEENTAFENDVYPYYRLHKSGRDRIKYYKNPYNGKSEPVEYLLRSINSYSAQTISVNGTFSSSDKASSRGLVPSFAIGVSKNVKKKLTVEEVVGGNTITIKSEPYIGKDTDFYANLTRDEDGSKIYSGIKIYSGTSTEPLEDSTYTYNVSTGELRIKPSATIDDITIKVEFKENKFYTDSWETFLDYAQYQEDGKYKGYDKLKEVYSDVYIANGLTFNGLVRDVSVAKPDGTVVNYQFKVVGEEEDAIYIGDTRKSSALTFEMNAVLEDEDIIYYDYDPWEETPEKVSYKDSVLNKRLNVGDTSITSVFDRIQDTNLKDKINETEKISKGDDPTKYKLFPLSASEYGKGDNSENLVYSYYKSGDSSLYSRKGVSSWETWTTRTVKYEWDEWEWENRWLAYTINSYGGIEKQNCYYDCHVSPAFSVGYSEPVLRVYSDIYGYDFVGEEKVEYGQKSYVGKIYTKVAKCDDVYIEPLDAPTKDDLKVQMAGKDVNFTYSVETETKETGETVHVGVITICGDESFSITGPISIENKSVPKISCSFDTLMYLISYDESNHRNGEFVKEYLPLGSTISFNTLDEKTCTCKVIGFGHDPLVVDPSIYAAVTFEYVDVIKVDNDAAYTTNYDTKEKGVSDFPNSLLNKYLNDEYINNIPSSISSNFKEVKKSISLLPEGADDFVSSSYNTKLFPLSFNEYNATTYYQDSLLDTSEAYEYYTSDDRFGTINKKRSASSEYWIRSPYAIPRHYHGYNLKYNIMYCYDGYISYNETGNETYFEQWKYAVKPAFCL